MIVRPNPPHAMLCCRYAMVRNTPSPLPVMYWALMHATLGREYTDRAVRHYVLDGVSA